MSLTMSQGDGMTVISVTTNPRSKWPLLCQILGTLCYSPVCSVAQKPKRKLTNTQTTLGVVQMIVGVINIVLGILLASFGMYSVITDCQAPFWLGGMFLAVGIVCVLSAKFPSPCLLVITVILNIVSAGMSIALLCCIQWMWQWAATSGVMTMTIIQHPLLNREGTQKHVSTTSISIR